MNQGGGKATITKDGDVDPVAIAVMGTPSTKRYAENVTLRAFPDTGFRFSTWRTGDRGKCPCDGGTALECKVPASSLDMASVGGWQMERWSCDGVFERKAAGGMLTPMP